MDREKVVNAYEDFVNGYECFCTSDDYEYEMHKAVLALLKEQEAVEPQLSISGMWYECPICHRHLTKDRDNYCARCGRRLKWE